MTFDQLQYFIVIAENKNMTKAAQQLNMVQPALSRTIQRLERELGIELFDRKGKSIELTAEGKTFLQFAKQCTHNFSRMQRNFLKEPLQGTLTIGNMLENDTINRAIVAFAKAYDYVNIEVSSAHKVDHTRSYNFFFGTEFYESNFLNGTFESIPLYEEPMTLVVNKNHPLADSESVKLSKVAVDYEFLLPQETDYTSFIEKFLTMASCSPTSHFRTNDMTIHASLLANTNYVAITPAYSIIHGPSHLYKHIKIEEPDYKRKISLYWYAEKVLTPLEETFIQFITDFFEKNRIG